MGQSAANKIERGFGRNEGSLTEESKTPDQAAKSRINQNLSQNNRKSADPGQAVFTR